MGDQRRRLQVCSTVSRAPQPSTCPNLARLAPHAPSNQWFRTPTFHLPTYNVRPPAGGLLESRGALQSRESCVLRAGGALLMGTVLEYIKAEAGATEATPQQVG